MSKLQIVCYVLGVLAVAPAAADQDLVSMRVHEPPTIDSSNAGRAESPDIKTLHRDAARERSRSDDVQCDRSRRYRFGILRFEIAGRKPNQRNEQPLFSTGEVLEPLLLTLGQSN
jgi:hypothetical protein